MPNSASVTGPDEARLLAAAQQLARKAYREAHALCLEVLRSDPRNGEAFYLLGLITSEHANFARAEELFRTAAAHRPDHAGAHAQQARCLIALSRRAEAAEAARRSAALRPADPFTLDTIGVVFSRSGLHAEALPFHAAASDAAPQNADYAYNHAAALQFTGALDAARAAYLRSASADPRDTRGLPAWVQITKQSAARNETRRLSEMFAAHGADPEAALRIGHALAKTHEDLGQPEEALGWLARAKAAMRAEVAHDPQTDARLFAAAERACAALDVPRAGLEGGPVFICGMPRTGTTLVDRILSGHSALTPAGELTDFALCLKRRAKTRSNLVLDPETLEAATNMDLAALGQDYLAAVAAGLGITGRFTDKMPLNILMAPVILAALPNARIICLRRHPGDTVLSNYRQMFATRFPYYNYAYALEDTARYFVGFDLLVRRFEAQLPQERFTVVHYENVVADLESETRRLLGFCGLAFEAQCLDFHENAAPVATASSAQVREPLYTGALGRWRRYEAGLKPALDILEAAGCLGPGERSPG